MYRAAVFPCQSSCPLGMGSPSLHEWGQTVLTLTYSEQHVLHIDPCHCFSCSSTLPSVCASTSRTPSSTDGLRLLLSHASAQSCPEHALRCLSYLTPFLFTPCSGICVHISAFPKFCVHWNVIHCSIFKAVEVYFK